MTSAALILRTHRISVSARPNRNTNWAVVVGKLAVTGMPLALHDEAAVDEADEQDEQADAGPDGPLQGQRHGVHDRFAEADDDEDRDQHALEHDDAHRTLPATGRGRSG